MNPVVPSVTASRQRVPVVVDAIVVGAGIVGAACARRLAESGLRVAWLEREAAPATGSTARSAAGVRVQFSDATNIALSAASIAEYRQIADAAFDPCGYLFLVPPADWPAHLEAARLQQRLGHPVQVLTPDASRSIVDSDTEGLAGATFCATDGFVDPHGITMHFARLAKAAGARLMLGHRVEAIERRDDEPAVRWQVHGAGECWQARWLINACGAWAGELGALAGLDVPVGPARRMVFCSGPLPFAHRFPLTVDVGSGAWFRSEGPRLLFGRSDPTDTGFSEGIHWPWLDETIEPLLARFPWFERVTLDRKASWWGYYEVTPDHQPLLGPTRQAPGWLNACGFSGHGVQQAAAVGRVITAMVRGEAPPIDVGSLDSDRFAGGAAKHTTERLIV